MFNKNYYIERKQKLQKKSQRDVQNFLASIFVFVDEQRDIVEQLTEINNRDAEEVKPKKK